MELFRFKRSFSKLKESNNQKTSLSKKGPMKQLFRINLLKILLPTILLFQISNDVQAQSRLRKGLLSETNGVFIGLTQNQFHFDSGGSAEGVGWQAGIIQKTERRPYGYLTGLFYFENITATGTHPTKGKVKFQLNSVVFSLWLTMIWRENDVFSPMLSLGPAFDLKIKSTAKTQEAELSYNNAILDVKGQVSLGAYIRLKKNLFLNPQFFGSYNLMNNNHLARNWDVNQEINYGFQIGLSYSADY